MNIEQMQLLSVDLQQINNINYCGLKNINNNLDTHYLVYKIINVTNGHYYIGQHKTTNPIDKYMGSGKYIEHAIAKYPLSNFVKEILFDFDNFDDMNNKEKELVPLSSCFPYNDLSYNLIEGGNGQLSENVKLNISKTLKSNGKVAGKNNPMYGYKWSDTQRQHQSEVMKGRIISDNFRKECSLRLNGKGNPMYGKQHSTKSKLKISNTRKEQHIAAGKNNPMYNLKCLTEDQKIKWKQKISQGNKSKKRTDEFKKRLSDKAKTLNIRRMHDPITGKIRNVPQKNVQTFLDNGYILGTGIKSRLGKVGYCAGKRIMTAPDGSKHYVKIEEIQQYIELGWKTSKRSKSIKKN